jgi:hypothetical protein
MFIETNHYFSILTQAKKMSRQYFEKSAQIFIVRQKRFCLTLLGSAFYTEFAYFNGSEAHILHYPRSCNQAASACPTRWEPSAATDSVKTVTGLCKKQGREDRQKR